MRAPEASLPRVAVWYAILVAVGSHAFGGLVGVATAFTLKDRLGLGPEAMARYDAILALPGYAAFLFGYARDRWSPRIGGDRNLAMLGAAGALAAYAFLAAGETTYGRLLGATLTFLVANSFLGAALNGAFVRFGSHRGVTDCLSGFSLALGTLCLSGFSLALGTLVDTLTGVAAGWAAAHAAYRTLLWTSVGLGLAYLGLLGLAPQGAFVTPVVERGSVGGSLAARLAGLARSTPYLAALGFTVAYNFGPASGSAVFFYFTDVLKAGPQLIGMINSVTSLATMPMALLYGAYARRFPLRRTMAVAMLVIFLQPFLFFAFRTQGDLLPVNALFGATNAIFLASVVDLLLRTIPKGSEGLGFAVYGTVGLLTVQVSNLIGSRVYAAHGLAPCVWLTFPVAALGFPLLPLVPRERVDVAEA